MGWIAYNDALAIVESCCRIQDAERHFKAAIDRGDIRARGNKGIDPSDIIRSYTGPYPGGITTLDLEYDEHFNPPPEKWEINDADLQAWIDSITKFKARGNAVPASGELDPFIDAFVKDNPHANRDEVQAAADKHFGCSVNRDAVRNAFDRIRPADHPSRKRGPKSGRR
jgi:hypothetical protein